MTMINDDMDNNGRVTTRQNVMNDGSMPSNQTLGYSGPRSLQRNANDFEGQDVAAFAVIAIMMLGPLVASAAGWGG